MTQKAYIRVTKSADNKIQWELMFEGVKIGELSYVEVLELAVQSTSSLRWVREER